MTEKPGFTSPEASKEIKRRQAEAQEHVRRAEAALAASQVLTAQIEVELAKLKLEYWWHLWEWQ